MNSPFKCTLFSVFSLIVICCGRVKSESPKSENKPTVQAGGTTTGGGGNLNIAGEGGDVASGGLVFASRGGDSGKTGMGCLGDTDTQIGITADSEELSVLYADGRQEVLLNLSQDSQPSLLTAGDYTAVTTGGANNEMIVWQGTEIVGSVSIDSDLPFISHFLSNEGFFIAETSHFSYFLRGEQSGYQEDGLHVVDVPNSEGIAPARWQEGNDFFVGFVHLESSTKEQVFLIEEGEDVQYADGVFLSINAAKQVMVRSLLGSTSVFTLEPDEGDFEVHISKEWGIVTRSGFPVLRILLKNFEAIPITLNDVESMRGMRMVSSAGPYFIAHDDSDGWPAWRINAASGFSDIPTKDTSWDGELYLLDSQDCGRSTQILSDGRLGVALRDNSRGYFFLEKETGSFQYSHIGIAVDKPSHLHISLQGNFIIMEHDGGENRSCALQKYNNLDTTPLVPNPASSFSDGVQLVESSGPLVLYASYPQDVAWERKKYSISSDGRCRAIREESGWKLQGGEPFSEMLLPNANVVLLR